MRLQQINVWREEQEGRGPSGEMRLGDVRALLPGLIERYAGQVQVIYLDPPFRTGQTFVMRVRVGEKEWKSGAGTLVQTAYADDMDFAAYMALMRETLTGAKQLLSDTGVIYLHIDYHMHPHLRLLMDEIFGEANFLNEIVWSYQTGGRARRFFSRKHDVILFYARTRRYDFNIDAVKAAPTQPRPNHMRRHVDPDGRVYRSIRTNGRVYTYYDDEPVAPTDVWQDLSHLQQKDPERTGYDAQKPLALLERIVKCASRPGEWVLDPFAGSGTTLEAAKRNGRSFIGIDRCPLTVNILRRRLAGADYRLLLDDSPSFGPTPVCSASVRAGVGFYHVFLESFEADFPGLPEGVCPLDGVDNWSVGYLRPQGYQVMAEFARSRREGELARELAAPAYEGQLAMCVSDVTGRSFYFALDRE